MLVVFVFLGAVGVGNSCSLVRWLAHLYVFLLSCDAMVSGGMLMHLCAIEAYDLHFSFAAFGFMPPVTRRGETMRHTDLNLNRRSDPRPYR